MDKSILERDAPAIFAASMICSIFADARRHKAMCQMAMATTKHYKKYKKDVFRAVHSNNWLKMHGYPLRRGFENKRTKGL